MPHHPSLYLIDASGLCYRAYHALGNLATSYGQPTGAIFGFTNILNKILKGNPEYLACCFDVSRHTFRQEKFVNYKIHRPAMPEGLASQMSLIKEVVSAYNIAIFELKGYEADDLIATLCRKARKGGLEVVIVSSDKDILQLVDAGIKALDPKKDKAEVIYDLKQVRLRFGLEPKRIVDMISLMGDAADNIPGVSGIGEKTALTLLKEFGGVSELLENVSKIKSLSLRKAISDNVDNIRLSYELASLKDDLDIDFDIARLKSKPPDFDKLFSLFKTLEFSSLIKGLPEQPREKLKEKCEFLEDSKKKEEILSSVEEKKELFLVLSCEEGKIYFSLKDGPPYWLPAKDAGLGKLLSNPGIRKIGHNLKEIKNFFLRNSLTFEGMYFDTMLAAYLLDSSMPNFNLGELAFRYLDQRYPESGVSPEASLDIIRSIAPVLKKNLKEKALDRLFYELDMPLADVLASMQASGVRIDTRALKDLSAELENRMIGLRSEIYALNNNEEFNLNSPRQLAVVLFDRLRLKVVKKTKTGPSTDEEVLSKLSKEHKLPLLILEYRRLAKLKNTYIDSLPELIDLKTNRVHATFDQTGTETGRLSSNNPNLQNIPAKSDIANLIRRTFIAEKGKRIISADYSQIELRVLAHFSKDETLISAFSNHLDIHRHTASLIFGAEQNEVSDSMRETAKRINFGIVYGMSAFGLSKDLGIPQEEAKIFIDAYFLRYPGVKTFIDRQIRSAQELGYVTTLLGRRRFLPGINSNNNSLRGFAERQAVNSTIQGSAADLIKLAMINIFKDLKQAGLKAVMIMQIHDELVFELPDEELKVTIGLIKSRMEGVFDLLVPLEVNIKQGQNWSAMELVKAAS